MSRPVPDAALDRDDAVDSRGPTRRVDDVEVDLDPDLERLALGRRVEKDDRREQRIGPSNTVYVSIPLAGRPKLGDPAVPVVVDVREHGVVIVAKHADVHASNREARDE